MGVREIAKKWNRAMKNDNLALIADVIPQYERLPLGDLGVDFPLFGGIPLGRMVVFSGQEHSGKSLMSCVALAAYQRKFPDKISVYIDVEHSLDMQFIALMTGVDFSKVIYVNPDIESAEEITQMILDFQQEDDIGMIIIDSIPAMQSAINLDTDMDKDNGQRGAIAKLLHRFLPTIGGLIAKQKNILIMINQVRTSKSFTGAIIYEEPCGKAPKYYGTVSIRCGKRTFIKGDKVDCNDGEGADGFRINFIITKNKTASIQRGGGFASFSYETGLDAVRDLLEIALKFEYIKRPTKQKYQLVNLETGEPYVNENGEELVFVGKESLISFLNAKENKEFVDKYFNMLNKYITSSNDRISLLDEATQSAIMQEEEALKEDDSEN